MANYRRLISYIYAYEGGVKGKNIGFAKLEARGGQCKIQVSVRKIYVGSQDTGVYLMGANGEIFLGKMFVRGGNGEFRTMVPYGNVAGTGQGIDQCYGLTIHDTEDSWRNYTTIWEDAVAHAAEVDLSEATAEKAREREMEQIPGSQISELPPDLSKGPEPPDKQEPAASGMAAQQEPVMPETAVNQEPAVPEAESPADEDSAVPGEAEKLWQHFQRHYPKIQAFDYKGVCEILLIKPQDIGLLPRETWNYGNNSFLLHGYYNYRYLILAKLMAEEGTVRFLLGVPGHYYSNEKYMASMFGFPNFVLSKMQPANDGRFGYWYTDIRLEN